jgi:hypothetical protein
MLYFLPYLLKISPNLFNIFPDDLDTVNEYVENYIALLLFLSFLLY